MILKLVVLAQGTQGFCCQGINHFPWMCLYPVDNFLHCLRPFNLQATGWLQFVLYSNSVAFGVYIRVNQFDEITIQLQGFCSFFPQYIIIYSSLGGMGWGVGGCVFERWHNRRESFPKVSLLLFIFIQEGNLQVLISSICDRISIVW